MAPINKLNTNLSGVSERILETREVDMGIDPVTGRRMVKLVINDPHDYYRDPFLSTGIHNFSYGSSGDKGIPGSYGIANQNYGTSGFVDLKDSSFYESRFMDMNSRSIHNWELHQKTLPKREIEKEIRKEFTTKKQDTKSKISNNPVKIEKKIETKKKPDIKKITNPILSTLGYSFKFLFPVSFIHKIIKKNRW
jgi:hypothetical protein